MNDRSQQHQGGQQQSGQTMERFKSLDTNTAQVLLREGYIGRQRQSGSLSPDQEENIRMGRQDQSIGFEDAVWALENAEQIAPQVQSSLGKQT